MLFEGQGEPGSLNHLGVETETWLAGPDGARWEWYVKTGDTEQFSNVCRKGRRTPTTWSCVWPAFSNEPTSGTAPHRVAVNQTGPAADPVFPTPWWFRAREPGHDAPLPPTMTTSRAEIDLAVPVAYAFEFLADPSTAPIIDPSILEYRPAPMPMALGTRNAIRMRVWGVPLRATSLVEQWAPPHLMVMVSERPTRPLRVRAIHRFDPTGPNACRYRWEIELTPVGPLGHLARRAFASFMQRNAIAQNERFKSEVERRWRHHSDQ